MATRAATFTAKIRNLKDYHYRMVNNMAPLPSGVDIANTLKFFSQTLLSVLKDIPSECFGSRLRDSSRLSVLPSLNYSGLYEAVMNMIDVVPLVLYGQHVLGEAILNSFGCLASFLEYDLLDTLPYTVASTLAIFPASLQKDTIDLLCFQLLPITMGHPTANENLTYATDSTAAIIMMVFQYTDNGEYHSQLLENIMSMKKNVFKDLLNVIAYGPPASRAPAVDHLFHYWPQLNPSLSDRRGIHSKYLGFNFKAWKPIPCQRENCPNAGKAKAVKMCLDPALCAQCGDRAPPVYICIDCVDQLQRDLAKNMVDILQPLERVSLICENKNCTSAKNSAICTCFSTECASRPIRYCPACNQSRHSTGGGANHIYHETIANVWACDPELQGYLVEAIVSLLKEAAPLEEKRMVEMGEERVRQHFEEEDDGESEESDERKLLSRYAIWLMVELCKPKPDIPIEILGRLLAMLFQWFDATAYLPDDNVGTALERLKPEYIYKWLQEVSKTHFEVILSCLLPHPVEYAQVGGYWDTLASRTCQIKEGLNRLFCLLPYDIITYEVWDYVMPFWLEAIRTEVPDDERHELKVLLCKSFETEMCPLPFSVERMYHFVAERFENTSAPVQEQNLSWLQILSSLEILIPLPLMLGMFRTGVQSLSNPVKQDSNNSKTTPLQAPPQPATPTHVDDFPLGSPLSPAENSTFAFPDTEDEPDEPVSNMTCFIMMFDLIIKQMQLQETIAHEGVYNDTCRDIMNLMVLMLRAPWPDDHTCGQNDEEVVVCQVCHQSALWHQLAAQVMEFVAPTKEIKIPDKDLPKMDPHQPPDSRNPQHRAMNSKANKSRDHGRRKSKRPVLPKPSLDIVEDEKDFDIPSLPVHLQLLHVLLKHQETEQDSDAQFYLLRTMKFLVLHAQCLNHTVHDHEHFVKFCLHKLLIPNLFKVLRADRSQMAVFSVPILLHCLTLPSGADIFWNIVEAEFSSDDWKARFASVEKVTVLARMLNPESVKNNQVIQTTLAHAFCHLIGCLNDVNSAVVQRTRQYMESIKASALKCLCECLEFQFDTVISDRAMILQRLMLLDVVMPSISIFTWDFFLNRFDTLCLEAQLDLESAGDINALTDLTSSNRDNADHFMKKINRARFALARTDSIRSLTGSILSKPPYRRAASVPHHLISKSTSSTKVPNLPADCRVEDINELKPFLELLVEQEARSGGHRRKRRSRKKEKSYPRQQSAPQFGRRTPSGSRAGVGMFSNYMFPGGNLREFTDEESNFAALLQRAMEQEGVDRETIHCLVTLLMKFMVHVDEEAVNDDQDTSRSQKLVLRHLNVLLGYNQKERAFSVPPYKLRYSAVFNAYLSGLPRVLDKNFPLGNVVLPVSMALLQYCPSPQRYASDYQPANYTLWYLEPHSRQTWLKTLIIILYKYGYNTSPASSTIQTLVRIAINTIDAQRHRCRRQDDMFGPASPVVPRNRDTSNVSIGDLENIQETETPPQSPTDSQASVPGDAVTINMAGSSTTTTVHYHKKADSEKTEETDVESLSPTSKVTSPTSKVEPYHSFSTPAQPPPSPSQFPSPPRPSSPSSPISVRPSARPAFSLGSPHSGPVSPTTTTSTHHQQPGSSPTEDLARLPSSSQSRRIAEYDCSSLLEVRGISTACDAGSEGVSSPTSPSHFTFQSFPKRTLEESVEEYVRQQVGLVNNMSERTMTGGEVKDGVSQPETRTNIDPLLTSPSADVSVELKMVEQLKAFESQNGSKRTTGEEKEKSPSPGRSQSPATTGGQTKDVATMEVTQTTAQTTHTLTMVEGQDGHLPTTTPPKQHPPPPLTKEEIEQLYETESPKKIKRPPFGKTRSAGTLESSSTAPADAELDGAVHSRPERALSEQSPSVMEELIIECKSGGESGVTESELEDSPCPSPTPKPQPKPNFRQRKVRKTGLTALELQKMIPELSDLSEGDRRSSKQRRSRRLDMHSASQSSLLHKRSLAGSRFSETLQVDRCPECNAVLEQYDEETISLCVIALATFIHRESGLAAPLLPDMLQCVARIAASSPYPWQTEITGLIVPGNCVSVARQFIRCALHQLAPNGIFPQLFMSEIEDPDTLKTMAVALVDFAELNCYSALQLLLEGVNETKNITSEQIQNVVINMANYLDCVTLETSSPSWANILIQFEIFFRRLPGLLPNTSDMSPVLKIIIAVLKIPGLTSVKSILEPFSKLLSLTLRTSTFKLQQLLDICSLCGRAFTKERDKLYLARCIILELIQALKFKESLPDENLIMLVQFVCTDAGGTIGPISIVEELANITYNPNTQSLISTNAAECMKAHLHDCVEFIADLHTITKTNFKGGAQNLNEDTLGSHLKAGIAQFVALEFTRGNGRDNRAISRYMPWLFHPPSAMQQGTINVNPNADGVSTNSPKEFIDCVGHIRLLSWLLIGSLTHTAITKAAGPVICMPIPLEASLHIADHVMVIMTGFAEQSKASVLHMSSLFHAFILCQLWTMYCESCAAIQTSMSEYRMAHTTIMDFWGRVTPGILQLLSHSKLAEMVNLHFLSLMEALQECNSTILSKLFPMWTPILFSYHNQLPGHMRVRLQMCQNWAPKQTFEEMGQTAGAAAASTSAPLSLIHGHTLDSNILMKWLKRLQFKLGQIEVQSSAATQFYSV